MAALCPTDGPLGLIVPLARVPPMGSCACVMCSAMQGRACMLVFAVTAALQRYLLTYHIVVGVLLRSAVS